MSSIQSSFFALFLIYNSFSFVFSEGCTYQTTKNGEKLVTNSTFLNSYKEDEISQKKNKCFSLSYSVVFQQKCCYDSYRDECTSDNATTVNKNISCSEPTNIPSNCGLAGVFQPANESACTEISLVEGYCCYVDFGSKGTSCIKTNKLNDDKNTITETIEKYIANYNSKLGASDQLVANSVICDGNNLKIASRILLIGLLLIL